MEEGEEEEGEDGVGEVVHLHQPVYGSGGERRQIFVLLSLMMAQAVDREVAEYNLVFLCRARGIRVIQGLIRTSHALRDSFQNAPC